MGRTELRSKKHADGMPPDEFSEVRLGGRQFPARYNVAPRQQMPVVFDEDPRRLMKYWEMIADKLARDGWTWALSPTSTATGGR